MALLQESFPGRVISRRADINWPPRSGDLTFLCFCVNADKPSTLEHIKTNIRQVIDLRSRPIYVKKWLKITLKRINACNTSHGGHLNDLVFHTHNVNVQTLQ